MCEVQTGHHDVARASNHCQVLKVPWLIFVCIVYATWELWISWKYKQFTLFLIHLGGKKPVFMEFRRTMLFLDNSFGSIYIEGAVIVVSVAK